jgi:hypothetical protein
MMRRRQINLRLLALINLEKGESFVLSRPHFYKHHQKAKKKLQKWTKVYLKLHHMILQLLPD